MIELNDKNLNSFYYDNLCLKLLDKIVMVLDKSDRVQKKLEKYEMPLVGSVIHDYKLVEILDIGGFGAAYIGVMKGKSYVIKINLKENDVESSFIPEYKIQHYLSNDVHDMLIHKHIPIMKEIIHPSKYFNKSMIIMEYLKDYTSLYIYSRTDFIIQHRKNMTKKFQEGCLTFLKQLFSCVNDFHMKGVNHMDLQYQNIFVKGDILKINDEDSNFGFKIIDFGISCVSKDLGKRLKVRNICKSSHGIGSGVIGKFSDIRIVNPYSNEFYRYMEKDPKTMQRLSEDFNFKIASLTDYFAATVSIYVLVFGAFPYSEEYRREMKDERHNNKEPKTMDRIKKIATEELKNKNKNGVNISFHIKQTEVPELNEIFDNMITVDYIRRSKYIYDKFGYQ
jgi:serine/threonine protein kinase